MSGRNPLTFRRRCVRLRAVTGIATRWNFIARFAKRGDCLGARGTQAATGLAGDRASLRRMAMFRILSGGLLAGALMLVAGGACAFDDANSPDWKGQWHRLPVPGIPGAASFDPNKRGGLAQEAPLTPEYQKIFEANLAEQAAGGHGIGRSHLCIPPGMPMAMNVYEPMEIIITGDTTHITIQSMGVHRRIFTDGREWPVEVTPAYLGYSIGKWIDVNGDGRLDTLEVETRHMKGPRVFDPPGLPLHADNRTVINERFYLDKTDSNILRND